MRSKFQPDGYKDVFFAAAFIVTFLAMLGWIGYSATSGLYQAAYSDSESETSASLLQGDLKAVDPAIAGVTVSLLSIVMSTSAAVGWLTLLQVAPETMVYFALYTWVGLFVLSALAAFVVSQVVLGAVSLLFAALMVCMIMSTGRQIKFTAQCFKCVSGIYKTQPGIFLVAALAVFLQCFWQIMSIAAVVPAAYKADQDQKSDSSSSYTGVIIVLMVCYYWGAQVFSNLLHITCCGIVGRWYFNTETQVAVQQATKQAFTNYFGSVCFGSLLVAVIQTLKTLVEQRRAEGQRNGQRSPAEAILFCVLACVLSCLESLAVIFNTFAFVVCAIYGTDYITGGKEGMKVLTQSGCKVLLSYNFAGIVCVMGSLMGALIVGLATWALAAAFGLSAGFAVAIACVGAFTTFFIMSVVARTVESGCDTLFVCFAEEPEKLRESAPEVQQAFNEVKSIRR